MYLNTLIDELHKFLIAVDDDNIMFFPSAERMTGMAILFQIHLIIEELEKLNSELDFKIKVDAINLDYDKILSDDYWKLPCLFNEKIDSITTLSQISISKIADYFPAGNPKYQFTTAMIPSLKNAFHQITDNEKLCFADMAYALNSAKIKMIGLLTEIKEKVDNPKDYMYKNVWEEISTNYNEITDMSQYQDWVSAKDRKDFESLRIRQLQEILKLIKNNFFRYYDKPTIGEKNNCLLVKQENYLPGDFIITDELKMECARFEHFINWKENAILIFDYELLGRYISEHGPSFSYEEYVVLNDFDNVMDVIHEEMANKKPNLSKYLKRYEENKVISILNDCSQILNSCQKFLKGDIRNTFLREYLNVLLYDNEIKNEVRQMLVSKTKKKYLCHMIAALDCFHIFDVKVVKEDLAQALSESLGGKPAKSSIKSYIDKFERERKGALYVWTKKNIDELKSKPNNPF